MSATIEADRDIGLAAYLAARLDGVPEQTRPRLPRPETEQGSFWRPAPKAPADSGQPGRALPVSVSGAHGGAGTSTVARLMAAADLGQRWPAPGDGCPPRVIAVARTNAAGLMAVSQVLARYHGGGCPEGTLLAGVVLVADAPGRLPRALTRRIAVLSSAVPVHRLPWVPAWRVSEVAPDPAEASRLAAGLQRFAERTALAWTPPVAGEGF
jgi:hypothetical protein